MTKIKNPSVMIVILVLLSSFIGCRATKVVEVPRIKKVTVDKYIHDSVYISDSVIVPFIYCPDDTIQKEQPKLPVKEKYRTEIRYENKSRDSIQVDSIPFIINVPYPVEKKLSWLQKTQIYLCNTFLVGSLFFVLVKYRKNIIKLIIKFILK